MICKALRTSPPPKFLFTPRVGRPGKFQKLRTAQRSKQLLHYSGEGNGNPLQYSCLENPMDGGAWWATVHGSQSRTQLSNFTFLIIEILRLQPREGRSMPKATQHGPGIVTSIDQRILNNKFSLGQLKLTQARPWVSSEGR